MNTNEVARIAALVGEPARTAMLLALLDGRAFTANELARVASVQPATASRHLAQLVEAGLVLVHASGRHRYHRLASAEVAQMLEGIMQLAASARRPGAAPLCVGPREAALRAARTCYDHIAGRLGVAIADRLLLAGAIAADGALAPITAAQRTLLAKVGVDVDALAAPRATMRAACRLCLDWSERRFHVAGALGAAILAHGLERGWLRRGTQTRALAITASGAAAWRDWLGHDVAGTAHRR